MDTTLPGILTVNEAGHVIALVSILVSLVSILVRKATVDYDKVKESKEKMKEHQKRMKDAQKKGDDKAMLRSQEEMTKHMMDQMKQSFKPMLITIIPFLLVFNYMAGTYGDLHPAINVTIEGILPQTAELENVHASDNGTIDSQNKTVTWHLEKAAAGSYKTFSIDADVRTGTPEELKEIKAILTYSETNGTEYTVSADDTQPPQGSVMALQKSVENPSADKVAYRITCRNTVSNDVAHLTVINVGLTWFWWYFVVSIIASMILNKALKAS